MSKLKNGTLFSILIIVMALLPLSSCGSASGAESMDCALLETGGAIYVCTDVDVVGNTVTVTTSAGYRMAVSGSFRIVELDDKEGAIEAIQKLRLNGTILQ